MHPDYTRVSSLKKILTGSQNKPSRVEIANEFINVIANCGRNFFITKKKNDGGTYFRLAHFEQDEKGKVYFCDDFTECKIYISKRRNWSGFSHGGTLQCLVLVLNDYIKTGKKLTCNHLGPWPDWYCNGDLWGYGDDMQKVRDSAISLGIMDKVKKVAQNAT